VWAMVALYKQVHLTPPRAKRPLNPDERPKQAITPHQVWFADPRYLVKLDGRWRYSGLIFDGYSRAIVGAGCVDRQNFAQLVQVFRQAMAQWGAPEAVVSDHGAVFVALQPCLAQVAIQWAPITRGHPWQNLAAGGFSVQCHRVHRARDGVFANTPSSCRTISSGALGRPCVGAPKGGSITCLRKSSSPTPGGARSHRPVSGASSASAS
jgi:transposase InsO family protein